MPNINFTSIDTGTETHEEKREEPEISFNQQIGKMFSDMPKSFDDTDMFAVYAAALLQRNSVPYDGTYHQLSAIKRLRNGEWEIDYTEDEVIDEKMDSYYLLDDEVEIDDGAADIGIIDTNHFLTVLFGNGMIYSGKYKCRETRREYNERLIEWNRQKASDNISLIEKYLYEKDILFDFDAFLRMKG